MKDRNQIPKWKFIVWFDRMEAKTFGRLLRE